MAPARSLSALLACSSFFSQGRSTVSPGRLVRLAAGRGFRHVGLADWCSVSGAVELGEAAREHGVGSSVGATLPVSFPATERRANPSTFSGAQTFPLVLIARSVSGYAQLCELITRVNLEHPEGLPLNLLASVVAGQPGQLVCLTGGRLGFPTVLGEARQLAQVTELLRTLRGLFSFDLYVQLFHGAAPQEHRRLSYLRGLARDLNLPTVAAPEISMGEIEEYPLLDALTCARLGIDVQTPHTERPRNDARHVGTPEGWGQALPFPDALLNADTLARECALDLRSGRLHSPKPRLPEGLTAQGFLRQRASAGLELRYRSGEQATARLRLHQELAVVETLGLEGFFLTAMEVTDYCRANGILAAGRGSAAASVLCYALGITLSDPVKHDLLFERFLHTGQEVMPDVDIDIASSGRDQVLAWTEERWGGEDGRGQAMVANRVTYRLPSALQDLGRALGLPPELRDRLSNALGRDYGHLRPHRAREAEEIFTEVLGRAPVQDALLNLLTRIEPGFVRHLAPHSGGTVLSARPLTEFSPLTRSSGGIRMLGFDKDDVERLGLIKLDLLGLRMLAALERAREEALRLTGDWVEYGDLPDDPEVWARLASGDTMSLFQIESPAQVQMSARLQPKTMTQLAHQIALVRPGPIQSGTVHPYVRRARGEEAVPELPEPLKGILAPTYGTLMYQEQILRLAVHYAGMSWSQADRFRSRLSKAEDPAELAALRSRFVEGAAHTTGAFPWEAEEVFDMCAAFRGFGFAESHSHAFAQHSYASAWMRHHHPAAFLAGVLSEHPGMWPVSTLSLDAGKRGVRLAPLCINRSGLTYRAETQRVVRVPLSAVVGLSLDAARRVVQERLTGGKFLGLEDVYNRCELQQDALENLVNAGAFDQLGLNRREASYQVGVLAHARPPGKRGLLGPQLAPPELEPLSLDETLFLDLHTKGLSEGARHPLDAHRARLRDLGALPLGRLKHGQSAWTAGLIVARQKPPTAKGFAFFVLEDGFSRAQAVISPDLWAANRALLRDAHALIVQGEIRRQGQAVTLTVQRVVELPLALPRVAAG